MSDFDFRKASSPTSEELSEVADLIRQALDKLG
jgi:hypothetical protein